MRNLRKLSACLFGLAMAVSLTARAGVYDEIIIAANQGNTETVVGLLNRGMDVNTADMSGATLLMIAVRTNNAQLLEFLLRNRANTLKRNKYGDTAIGIAALGGQLDMVRQLAAHGADIDPPQGWTPLHYAAFNGHAEIIRFLTSRGADVNRKAPNSQTGLMLATKRGCVECVQALLDSHAQTDIRDSDGNSALMLATAGERSEIAEMLKRAGAQE